MARRDYSDVDAMAEIADGFAEDVSKRYRTDVDCLAARRHSFSHQRNVAFVKALDEILASHVPSAGQVTEAMIAADSVLSLIHHRYRHLLPDDHMRELVADAANKLAQVARAAAPSPTGGPTDG